MFGSQVLEAAIGLFLMFFIVALGASSIVEIISRLFSKRATDLENAIAGMLAGTTADATDVQKALASFKGTSIYDAAQAAAGTSLFRKKWKRPSYISAKAFADAVTEMTDLDASILPAGVRKRVQAIAREASNDVRSIKAGLEGWFDENMSRVEGAYKRWVTMLLFVIGSMIAIAGNASTFHVADRLWHDPVTRQVVSDAANKVVADGEGATQLESVADTTDKLEELGVPVGWDESSRAVWRPHAVWRIWEWGWAQLGFVAGWLLTGILVTLGAPFWFDLLTKVVSLRNNGPKPPTAQQDPTSATRKEAEPDQVVAFKVAVADDRGGG
jgi:hypothetical protein